MNEWIDGGVFAGLSAVMTYWFFTATIVMVCLTWRWRGRFFHWRAIGPRGRADAVLNVSLLFILMNAAFQRAVATYSFAFAEWKLTGPVIVTAPIYMPSTLLALAGFLWWGIRQLSRPIHVRVWWFLMGSGVVLFVAVDAFF